MKTLDETDILRVMREEWDRKVKKLSEDAVSISLNVDVDGDGREENVISPELKVVHKDSKIRYTIDSVSPRDVILRTPEGEQFLIDRETLEREYALD